MLQSGEKTEDRFLMKRAADHGDRTALGALYTKYYQRIEAYVASRIGSVKDAEDIAQDVFLELWRPRASRDVRQSAEAYLFGIARNAVGQYRRNMRKRPRVVPIRSVGEIAEGPDIKENQSLSREIPAREREESIKDAVARLLPKAREAVLLRFVEGLSTKEAAEKAGCSVDAFYRRLERAVKALQCMRAKNEVLARRPDSRRETRGSEDQ